VVKSIVLPTPAQAQASPESPVSPLLRVTVTYSVASSINNCSNGSGTLYDLVITYEDSSGNVSGASQLNVVSIFNPGGATGFTYNGPLSGWPRSSSIGSSNGTLSAQLCTFFGGSASNTVSVTLTNDVGNTASNSYVAAARPGANSSDNDEPSQSLLQ
jgi:hypothetical protein